MQSLPGGRQPIRAPRHGVLYPDGTLTSWTYDAGGRLLGVSANPTGTSVPYLGGIGYNARGQRTSVSYGNGVTTRHDYEATTFRLARILTRTSTGTVLQDLRYSYDPVGNITEIANAADDTVYFANTAVTPSQGYAYDALYRLVTGAGRERTGSGQPDGQDPTADLFAVDGATVRRYEEHYTYDEVGNLTEMSHAVSGTTVSTRAYDIATTSNRLDRTSVPGDAWVTYGYDGRGNITRLPHLRSGGDNVEVDFRDQMKHALLPGTDDASYLYDSAGQQVRKVVTRGATRQDRRYLGRFETLLGVRGTFHVMDGSERACLVETDGTKASASVVREADKRALPTEWYASRSRPEAVYAHEIIAQGYGEYTDRGNRKPHSRTDPAEALWWGRALSHGGSGLARRVQRQCRYSSQFGRPLRPTP